MSKPRRKLKVTAGKAGKSAKAKTITPAHARRLAGQHVADQMFKGAKVVDGAKAHLGPIYIVRQPSWKTSDTWVVYKNPEGLGGGMLTLKSSEVVLICKRTGRVLYEGSARDEG